MNMHVTLWQLQIILQSVEGLKNTFEGIFILHTLCILPHSICRNIYCSNIILLNLWKATGNKSCLILLHTIISSFLYLVNPMGTDRWLALRSPNHVPNTVTNYGVILLHHSINPNRLLHCFLKGRWLGLNTFPSKGHVYNVPLKWPPLFMLRRWFSHMLSRIVQQSVSFSCALSSISGRLSLSGCLHS